MSILLIVRDDKYRERLESLGLRVARAEGAMLDILVIKSGSGMPEIVWSDLGKGEQSVVESAEGGRAEAVVEAGLEEVSEVISENTIEEVVTAEAVVECANTSKIIMRAVSQRKPSMVMIHDADDHSKMDHRVVSDLMSDLYCEVMVLRLGEGDFENEKILVPCAGGKHSKVALRVAHHMAPGEEATALFVEPDADEVSESVGFAHLHRYVRRIGIGVEEVRCRVVLDNNVFDGIRDEVKTGDYGMMMIGAAANTSVRKKLFGLVPQSMMQGESAMSVAVFRSARPVGHKLRDVFERTLLLNLPQLTRGERVNLFDEIEEKSRWSFDFAMLMILSTAIASLGLIADSGAVVIGAMLVAPLMMPILGGGLALVQGNFPLWKRCQNAVILGFISAFMMGYLMGLIANGMGRTLTSQLAARGEPTLLDLGVAFVSGVAAAYCLARPKLSGALAGVAIAAALVPPIATAGICLATGQFATSQGAALLFGTNVVAIVIGAACNFFVAGVRGKSSSGSAWGQRLFITLALCMAGLFVPLSSTIVQKIVGVKDAREVIISELESKGIKAIKIDLQSGDDGVKPIEIHIDENIYFTSSMLNELQMIVESESKSKVSLRLIKVMVGK